MSILKQTFIIEKYDGTETICRDITAIIRKDPREFRLSYGTHFNFRNVPKDEYGRRVGYRPYNDKTSVYWVDIVRTIEPTWGRLADRIVYTQMLVDCKYVIRDGFGRAIHPDVLYQAFVAKYGQKATEVYEILYYGASKPIYRRYNTSPYYYYPIASKRDRGQRAYCYAGSRSNYRFKKQLVQLVEGKDQSNTVYDELVESPWDLVVVPPLREGSIDGTWYGRDWYRPRRSTHKSWKSQSKARKSWAKNLK